jgi:hypothetical protein
LINENADLTEKIEDINDNIDNNNIYNTYIMEKKSLHLVFEWLKFKNCPGSCVVYERILLQDDDNVELFKWFYYNNYPLNGREWMHAACCGKTEILRFIMQHIGQEYNIPVILVRAINDNNLELVKWLYNMGYYTEKSCQIDNITGKHVSFDINDIFHKAVTPNNYSHYPWNDDWAPTLDNINICVRDLKYDMLEYLIKLGYKPTRQHVHNAIQHSNIDFIKLLIKNGYHFDITCMKIATENSIHSYLIIKMLIEHGINWEISEIYEYIMQSISMLENKRKKDILELFNKQLLEKAALYIVYLVVFVINV